MTLHTPRLLLRPFGYADLENVFAGLSHPEVIRHYGVSFTTLEATQEQMDWYGAIERDGTGLWRAICAKGDDALTDLIHDQDLYISFITRIELLSFQEIDAEGIALLENFLKQVPVIFQLGDSFAG